MHYAAVDMGSEVDSNVQAPSVKLKGGGKSKVMREELEIAWTGYIFNSYLV